MVEEPKRKTMDIIDQAMRYLEHRPRTEKEMRGRLSEKGFADDEIDAAIEELKGPGYINDAEYGTSYLIYAFGKGRSLGRARYEMREKGLSAEDIQKAIFAYEDEFEVDIEAEDIKRAEEQARKFIEQNGTGEKKIAAMGRRLNGLGYSPQTIYSLMAKYREKYGEDAFDDIDG